MYVGPWQEYKLMKVIADLRDKNDALAQQQQEQQHVCCSSNSDDIDTASAVAMPQQQQRVVRGVGVVYVDERSASHSTCGCSSSSHSGRGDGGHAAATSGTAATALAATRPRMARLSRMRATAAAATASTRRQRRGSCASNASSDVTCAASAAAAATTRSLPPQAHVSSSALTQHPLVEELLRRAPLDTRALGARAGQRVYERCVASSSSSPSLSLSALTSGGGGRAQQDALRALVARRGGSCGGGGDAVTWSLADAELQARIERRLRLHALYAGDAVPAHVHDDEVQSQQQQPLVARNSIDDDGVKHIAHEAATVTDGSDAAATAADAADDVGALLHWADELDCDAIDAMM